VRLGGDEFAVLLNDVKREQAMAVSVKLRAALSEPFDLEEVTVPQHRQHRHRIVPRRRP